MNSNELYHYGVLGMKWGVRRAKVNAKKAKNLRDKKSLKEYDEIADYKKSKGDTKGYARAKKNKQKQLDKAQKFENKSKEILKKHEKRTSKETVRKVGNQSLGKTLIKTVVLGGTYGALKYNEARASENASRGKAFIEGTIYSNANLLSGGLMSFIEPRIK